MQRKQIKHLIVGIDPGTTIGIAVFDLEGNLLRKETLRNGKKQRVVDLILEFGTPCVVVTDVPTPPKSAIQIASYFNAKIFSPEKEMKEEEKNSLTRNFEVKTKHERDAIVGVIQFFKDHKNKFGWIDRVLKEKKIEKLKEEVRYFAIIGVPISDAINLLTAVPEKVEEKEVEEKKEEVVPTFGVDEIKRTLESNARLRARVSLIEAEKRLLERKITELESESRRRIERDEEIKKRDIKIKKLRRIIDSLKGQMEQSLKRLESNVKKREQGKGTKEKSVGDIKDILGEYREKRRKELD